MPVHIVMIMQVNPTITNQLMYWSIDHEADEKDEDQYHLVTVPSLTLAAMLRN